MSAIVWTDPTCHITPHFTVKEALWLPSWNRLANESDGLNDHVRAQLTRFLTDFAEPARAAIGGGSWNVHCMFRPKTYNSLIGGASDSAHMCRLDWAGIDFDVHGISCDMARMMLYPHLERLGLRMEKKPHSPWVHLDNRPPFPGQDRYFPV